MPVLELQVTKHIQKTAAGPGSKTKIEAPIHVSNVQLLERAEPKEPGGEPQTCAPSCAHLLNIIELVSL